MCLNEMFVFISVVFIMGKFHRYGCVDLRKVDTPGHAVLFTLLNCETPQRVSFLYFLPPDLFILVPPELPPDPVYLCPGEAVSREGEAVLGGGERGHGE